MVFEAASLRSLTLRARHNVDTFTLLMLFSSLAVYAVSFVRQVSIS